MTTWRVSQFNELNRIINRYALSHATPFLVKSGADNLSDGCAMISMPLFSLLIPTFNRERLIGATLESVLAQSCEDWELILVDDGSTDGTLEKVEAYRARFGERLRVLQQVNSGPGAARNRGIEAARGRYIAFLDSDDLWFPWTLNFYAQIIEQQNSPAFIAGAPLIFENQAQWDAAVEHPRAAPDLTVAQTTRLEAFADYLASGDVWRWFSVSSFVMRRDLVGDKRFSADQINGEDIDFTLQMGVEPGFVDVQSPPTFGYRRHPESAMANRERTVKGMENLIEKERRGLYPGGVARRRERLEILSRHLRPACLDFLQKGTRAAAWRCYSRTLSWHLLLKRHKFLLGFVLQSLKPARSPLPKSPDAARAGAKL